MQLESEEPSINISANVFNNLNKKIMDNPFYQLTLRNTMKIPTHIITEEIFPGDSAVIKELPKSLKRYIQNYIHKIHMVYYLI